MAGGRSYNRGHAGILSEKNLHGRVPPKPFGSSSDLMRWQAIFAALHKVRGKEAF